MLTRRELLEIIGLSSLYLFAHPLFASEDHIEVFPCGVASGDPSINSVLLWTRVDPKVHQKLQKPIKLYILQDLQGDPDKAIRSTVIKEFEIKPEMPNDNNDYTLRVSISGLEPGQRYFYLFEYAGVKKLGRFKTLPEEAKELSLAFVTCQNYEDGYYTAFRHIAEEEDIHFVLHLGDAIYEAVYGAKIPSRRIYLPSGNRFAVSLEDYRYLYRTYLSDPDYQLARAMHSFIYIWDDHEFVNDYFYDYKRDCYDSPSLPKRIRESKDAMNRLRMASIKAWYEYTPAKVVLNLSDPKPINWIKIYRDFKVKELMHLICTDERSYRQSQCPKRFQSPGCESQLRHTMLGENQLNWFLGQLSQEGFRWKVWANEVQFVSSRIDGLYGSTDAWDGYLKERERIIDFLVEHNTRNLIVLTGDRHAFLAAEIPERFQKDYSKVVGVELMTGAISSVNASEMGWWKKDLPQYQSVEEYTQAELSQNPWIMYLNQKTWGYSVLNLSPDRAECIFYSVNKYDTKPTKEVLVKFQYDGEHLKKA